MDNIHHNCPATEALELLIVDVQKSQKLIVDRLENLELNQRKSFPEGDFESHRRYHEAVQELLEEKKQLRRAIQEKTLAALMWSIIAGVCYACWHEVQRMITTK